MKKWQFFFVEKIKLMTTAYSTNITNPIELKRSVAQAGLAYVIPGEWIGVGTGSTVNCFIDALAERRHDIRGAVSSSVQSTQKLEALGIRVVDANEVERLSIYIDGADEIDPQGCMIKGGGAALTREKIVADLADQFVCIADASKAVSVLGAFPLPVEVIPMARAQIMRRLQHLGGRPVWRDGVVTDNGNVIVDVHGLHIHDPVTLENDITLWPGVVTVGLFARRRADVCLLGTAQGVQKIHY
jgi:ribose 5-phosphate isomerase A